MPNKVYVVQEPRDFGGVDLSAVEALGEVTYLLPAAPNPFDASRFEEDIAVVQAAIDKAGPNDTFVIIGGAPLSNAIFGAAAARAGRVVRFGQYSRGRDGDGRRDRGCGSYRIIPLSFHKRTVG